MSDEEFLQFVMWVVRESRIATKRSGRDGDPVLDTRGRDLLRSLSYDARAMLCRRGLDLGCHAGEGKRPVPGTIQMVEWYLGQFVACVQGQAWNSLPAWLQMADVGTWLPQRRK